MFFFFFLNSSDTVPLDYYNPYSLMIKTYFCLYNTVQCSYFPGCNVVSECAQAVSSLISHYSHNCISKGLFLTSPCAVFEAQSVIKPFYDSLHVTKLINLP